MFRDVPGCSMFRVLSTPLLYSDGVKGEPSPTWLTKYRGEDEEAVTRRAIKELKIFV